MAVKQDEKLIMDVYLNAHAQHSPEQSCPSNKDCYEDALKCVHKEENMELAKLYFQTRNMQPELLETEGLLELGKSYESDPMETNSMQTPITADLGANLYRPYTFFLAHDIDLMSRYAKDHPDNNCPIHSDSLRPGACCIACYDLFELAKEYYQKESPIHSVVTIEDSDSDEMIVGFCVYMGGFILSRSTAGSK